MKYVLLHFFIFWSICFEGYSQPLKRYEFEELKMGSSFKIILYAFDSVAAAQSASEAYLLIDSLNCIFSDYEPASELNRLSQMAGKDSLSAVSPIFFDLLKKSREAWRASSGRFDITIGALSKVWRKAAKNKVFPSATEIAAAKAVTGMKYLILDTIYKRAGLVLQGMQLDMGGIAKGFIAQYVLDYLRSSGFPIALTDAGGDIACGAAPPGAKAWSVAVSLPSRQRVLPQKLQLSNQSVATSGNMYRYIEHNGRRYSHEINPVTGYGITHQRNVTIVSPDGALSDWLATACGLLSVRKAIKLVRQYHADILILEIRNGKLKTRKSKGFKHLWE